MIATGVSLLAGGIATQQANMQCEIRVLDLHHFRTISAIA